MSNYSNYLSTFDLQSHFNRYGQLRILIIVIINLMGCFVHVHRL